MNAIICSIALTLMLLSAPASADVLEFTDKDEWIEAVGEFTTIDFTGFPEGTWITDQYADFGILFTDGDDWIHNTCGYVNDCWGLAGGDGNDQIMLAFDTEEAYIGVDFPGDLQIDLFAAGKLIYRAVFIAGGNGNFAGLVSTELFDSVVLSDPVFGFVAIDDLHFGPPPPESARGTSMAAELWARPTCSRCWQAGAGAKAVPPTSTAMAPSAHLISWPSSSTGGRVHEEGIEASWHRGIEGKTKAPHSPCLFRGRGYGSLGFSFGRRP